MKLLSQKKHGLSFQKIALISISVIALPLFLSVILFDWYTVKQQQLAFQDSRRSTLSIYRAQLEDVLLATEDYLSDTVANNQDFKGITFARDRTEAHSFSFDLSKQCDAMLYGRTMISGFFTYSSAFDYYRITYSGSYAQNDLALLKATVVQAGNSDLAVSKWFAVELSDRMVFMYVYSFHHTVVAAMVDPARQDYSGLEPEHHVFYTAENGDLYTPVEVFSGVSFPAQENDTKTVQAQNRQQYDLTMLPLSGIEGNIVYASPSVSFVEQLDTTQRILLAFTLFLITSIPLCWLTLRRFFLEPLTHLVGTTQEIQKGNTEIRVSEDSDVQEVTEIAQAVNTMLDTICQQKIDSYEEKLKTQQAQLQYLQLQIRPHFFLSCLNIIYSLAGEQKFSALQELTLDLSSYLRSVFKDSFHLIPLDTEIGSVESYIRIHQAGAQTPPKLQLEIGADTAELPVPPLSILTFVENSVKHSKLVDAALEIRISCHRLCCAEGDYLNITICDNGGGFSEHRLERLNYPCEQMYTGQHVGISNIRYRLHFLFGEKATLSFRNLTSGACVELFLPIEKN